MSYASKGEKVFACQDPEHEDCSPPKIKRSDHRLKRFHSINDKRAWDFCEINRYRHLYDLISGSQTCLGIDECHRYVPLEDLIRILMAEKDEYIRKLEECCRNQKGDGSNEAGLNDRSLQNQIAALTEEVNNSRELLRQAMHKLQNIDEIVNENKKLHCRLRCSEERVKYLEERKKHLECELADLRSKSQIQIDLERAQEMLTQVTQQRENSAGIDDAGLQELTLERDELQEKVKKLEKELEESKKKENEIAMLKKQSQTDSLNIEEMSKENECYRKKLATMKCLEKQIQELKKQGRGLADKYKREAQKAAEQMKKMCQASKELQALREERDSLRKRVDELASYECQYKALQRKLQRVDAVIAENEMLNSKVCALDKLEKENEYLRCRLNEIQELEMNAAEDKERILQLQCAVADQEEEMKDLLCQIEKLTSGRGEEELERLRCELYEKSSKLKLCEEQLAEIPMLEAEIDELRNKLQCCCRDFPQQKTGENKYQKIEVRFPATSTGIAANYKCQSPKSTSVLGTRREEKVEIEGKSRSCQEILQGEGGGSKRPPSSSCSEKKEGMSCEEVQCLLQSSKGIISCVLEDMIEHQREMEELEKCNRAMKDEIEFLKAKMGNSDVDALLREVNSLKKALEEKDREICRLKQGPGKVGESESDIEMLKDLNKQMKAELEAACRGLKEVANLEKLLESERRARCQAEKMLKEGGGKVIPMLTREPPISSPREPPSSASALSSSVREPPVSPREPPTSPREASMSPREASVSPREPPSSASAMSSSAREPTSPAKLRSHVGGVTEEDPEFDCCKALQREIDDLKLQILELNKLTDELKKENELLRELQQPCPDFSKELDEKCALENLLSLLQAELDAFKGQKLSDECEALRTELKRVMEQNCQLKALVDCYRQRLDLEKKSNELAKLQDRKKPGDESLSESEGGWADRSERKKGETKGSESDRSDKKKTGTTASDSEGSEGRRPGGIGTGGTESEKSERRKPGEIGTGGTESEKSERRKPGEIGTGGTESEKSERRKPGTTGSESEGSEGRKPGGMAAGGMEAGGMAAGGMEAGGMGTGGSESEKSERRKPGTTGSESEESERRKLGGAGSESEKSERKKTEGVESEGEGPEKRKPGAKGSESEKSERADGAVSRGPESEKITPGALSGKETTPGTPAAKLERDSKRDDADRGKGSTAASDDVGGKKVTPDQLKETPGALPTDPSRGKTSASPAGVVSPKTGEQAGAPGMDNSELLDELSRLKKLVAEKDAQLENQKNRCDEMLKARDDELQKLKENVAKLEGEQLKTPPGAAPGKEAKTLTDLPDDVDALKDLLKKMEEENAEKLRKLMDQHEKELSNRDKAYNDNLSAMKSGYETDIRKMAERHKQSIMRLQGLHEDEVQELNTNYETQMETMQTQSEEAINDVARGSAAKIRKISEQHSKEMKDIAAKFQGDLEEKENKHLQQLGALQDSLHQSQLEVETLKKKLKDGAEGSVSQLKAKHSREMQKQRKGSMRKLSMIKEKYEDEIKKSKTEVETLQQKLKEKQKGDGVCDCNLAKRKPRKPRDPTCPLDFNEVLEKILEQGLESLTFNEIALVHRKTCCALEGIVMNSNVCPMLEPPVGDGCPHTPILEADRQHLLSRIFALENEINKKQRQTQEAIINMEVAIKKERCRLQEVKNSLLNEQQKNSELKSLLSSQTKLQTNLKMERDKLGNQASLHQSLCMEKSKQLDQEVRSKKYLETEVEKLKNQVKQLCLALDMERGHSECRQKEEMDQIQLMRLKLEQSSNQEQRLALQLENETKYRMQLQCQLQALKQSFGQMVNLPAVESQVRLPQNPLEAKSVKEKRNLDQIRERKKKIKSKCGKKNKK